MTNLLSLTSAQLRHAASLKDQIDRLSKQLSSILGSPASNGAPRKRAKMSAAARAKIAKAQKARWAKVKKPAKPAKKKSNMSAAVKAKLSALAKARWAKIKASGKKSL
jgi:hypothetical protein